MIINNKKIITISNCLGFNLSNSQVEKGYTDYLDIIFELEEAQSNENVEEIVFLFQNCLGGTSQGLSELKNAIAKVSKPIISYVLDTLASAGLNLAVHTNLILASSSSQIGSVGTYIVLDNSQDDETLIVKNHEAIFKNPEAPYNEQVLNYLQERVEKNAKEFQESVFIKREIDDELIQNEIKTGKMFDAQTAKDFKLIDEIIDFQDFVKFFKLND